MKTIDHLIYCMEGSVMIVGRAMTCILGVRQPYRIADALPGADSLAIAMQLSNFWRDIGYDWSIGRVYPDPLQRSDAGAGRWAVMSGLEVYRSILPDITAWM